MIIGFIIYLIIFPPLSLTVIEREDRIGGLLKLELLVTNLLKDKLEGQNLPINFNTIILYTLSSSVE